MIVTNKSGCSKNLAACDISNKGNRVTWDNRISSMSPCSDAEETKANRPVDNGDLVEHDMLLVNSNDARTANGDSLLNTLKLVEERNNIFFVVKLCKHIDCKRQERILVQAGVNVKCLNFGGDWAGEVSSVYILYGCLEMFDGRNCKGQSIKFLWSFHGFLGQMEWCTLNLSRCGWNDRIRSMRSCAN